MAARELDTLAELQQGHTWTLEGKEPGRVAARTISQIAGVFGVSIDWLYAGTGKRPSDAKICAAASEARARVERSRTGTAD